MAFTKVTGPGIHTQANILSHNINSSGIITATEFSGPLVGNTNNTSGISTFYDLRVSNNLTVEGATTTLDTNLVGVDRVEVGANSNTVVGVAITQSGTADIINLFDGTSEVLTVVDTGEVGVGTITPNALLDIYSSTAATDKDLFMVRSTTGAFAVQCSSIAAANPEWRLRTYSGEDIVFSPGNVEKVRIHSNGAISAGVDNDSYELTLQGMSGGAPTLWLRDGTTTGSPRIIFGDTGSATRSAIYHKNTNSSLNFYTNGEVSTGDERLTIDSAGKVGIATITPRAKFDVRPGGHSGNGAVTFTTGLGEVGSSNNAIQAINGTGSALQPLGYRATEHIFATQSAERLRITSEGYLKLAGTISGSDNKLGRFLMPSHDSSEEDVMYMQFQQEDTFNQLEFGGGSSSYNAATAILFRTAAIDTVTGTERLRIDSSGSVKITKANNGVVSGALQINTTLTNYGTIQVRDSNQANISALQVENSGSGTNETNKVIRSVNLGSNAWANAAYHAKEHKFRISGETDTENVVLINTTGLDVASSKLLTTGRVNVQKGLTTAPSILVGANNGGSGMANNSTKHANICCPQYLSDTQTGGFRLLSAYGNDGNNYCYIGGNDDNITGTATHPKSATEVRIFTSATATGNGVERLRVDKDGRIIVGGSGGADPTQTTITAKGNSSSATSFSVIDLRRGEAADAVDDVLGYIRFSDTNITSSNENYAHIHAAVDKASTNASDNPGRLVFSTTADGDPGPTERFRITSDGNLYLGGTASVNDLTESGGGQRGLVIGNTGMGNAGIAIINSTTGTGRIYFGDATGSNAARNRGFINYYHNDSTNSDYMIFGTAGAEALRIQSDGNFGFGTSSTIRERMHLHTASSDEAYLRFTNTGTGTDAGDGFNIGISSAEQALIWNKEYTDMLFGTHGSTRLTISKDGKAIFTEEIETPQDYPNIRPRLDFNFAAVKKLDSRFTYTRIGPASYIDEYGKVVLVCDNTPRFDHDIDTGECKGLLIEDNRTNLIPHSFDNGNWATGSGGSTVTRNAGTAPDGTETATKILSANNDIDVNPQLGNASAGATGQISISGSTTYTLSLWVKASTTSQVGNNFKVRWKRVQGDSTFAENAFTLPANWTRYTATATTAANNSTIACYVGGVSGSEALVWGAQFEAGSFATSLIPTYGAAVTRDADFVGITGDEHTDFWNTSEGTYIIDYKPLELAVGDGVIIGSKRGNNGSGYPWALYRHDTTNTNNFKSYDLTNSIVSMSTTWADRRESWALGFNGTNGSIVRNGTQLQTNNANMNGLIDANELWLGSSSTGSIYSMHVRRFMYYAKRITDSQLITLTS